MAEGWYPDGPFATSSDEAEYPELWNRRLFAFCPSLGVSGASVLDQSGNANHGTISGLTLASAWTVSAGQYGLQFDGTSNHNVGFGNPKVLQFGGQVTLVSWFNRPSAPASFTELGGKRNGSGTTGFGFGWNSTPVFRWILAVGGVAKILTSASTYSDGAWHCAIGTYDGSNLRLYIDGKEDPASPLAATGSMTADTSDNMVFGSFNTGTFPYNGLLDDTAIYDRCLSLSEILTASSRRGISYIVHARKRRFVPAAAATGNLFRQNPLTGTGTGGPFFSDPMAA